MARGFADKSAERQWVWDRLSAEGVARFPFPPHGRIPNFAGAEVAAALLLDIEPWKSATAVKVNPDSPQRPLRAEALRRGITIFVPTPRLRGGFKKLDPRRIPPDKIEEAASLSRGHRWSEEVALAEMPELTLAQLIAGAECEDRADAHAKFLEGELRVAHQGGRGRCTMRGRQSMPGGGSEMPETPTFGRYAEIPYDQMTPEQQEGYRLLIETRGALGGPNKVWVHNPKLAKVMGPLGAYFRTGYSLSEREREIAVVIINSNWHSIYPTNAHERAGKAAGLPADKVEAMLSGLPTSFDNKREQVVYEMATCLANSRWVPKGLYDRAVEALGHAGITDVICLMGFYTSVSMTLAFYDVPAGATGMAR